MIFNCSNHLFSFRLYLLPPKKQLTFIIIHTNIFQCPANSIISITKEYKKRMKFRSQTSLLFLRIIATKSFKRVTPASQRILYCRNNSNLLCLYSCSRYVLFVLKTYLVFDVLLHPDKHFWHPTVRSLAVSFCGILSS